MDDQGFRKKGKKFRPVFFGVIHISSIMLTSLLPSLGSPNSSPYDGYKCNGKKSFIIRGFKHDVDNNLCFYAKHPLLKSS